VADRETLRQVPTAINRITYLPGVVEACLRDLKATFDTDPDHARVLLSRLIGEVTLRRQGAQLIAELQGNLVGLLEMEDQVGNLVPGGRHKRSRGCGMDPGAGVAQVPPEILARVASRSHLLTTGTVPWTVEGFGWACACLVEPTVAKIPYWPVKGDRPVRVVQPLHSVRAKLDALRATAYYPRLAPILVGRYGIDAGTAHYYRFLAIARFVDASFFHLSASRFIAMVEDTLILSGQLAESLVKMPYPAPNEPSPYALQIVLQDTQRRKEESTRLQALPEDARVGFLVEREYRQGMGLLRSQFAWDLPGYDDAMAYVDDVHAHPERVFLVSPCRQDD
jgi:hypothetical protein